MRRKISQLTAVLHVLLIILIGLLVWLVAANFTWAAGGLRDRNLTVLDLRGQAISPKQYLDAQRKLPDCRILWDVPLRGQLVASDSQNVTTTVFSQTEQEMMSYLPKLRHLDARGCREYSRLTAFAQERPEVQVEFLVYLGEQSYPRDAESVEVGTADFVELEEALAYLPELRTLNFDTLPEAGQLRQLRVDYPDLYLDYRVPLGGEWIQGTSTFLDLEGEKVTFQELKDALPYLMDLQLVLLGGSSFTNAECLELSTLYPNCTFRWGVEIGGKTFASDLTELDLSGIPISDAKEVEDKLVYFPNLERVVMCGCGLNDAAMDALNRRHEDIRFIWSIKVKHAEIRTDAKWFYPFKYQKDMIVTDEDLVPLRYCTDLEAIDIGHMTAVTNCEFVRYMPNLKYLIIVETAITDISPIATLKNLVFLEIFTTKITDYTPLLECTALEDLNLGNTYGDEEPILQMTWLKNLWWSGIQGSIGKPCSDAPEKLKATLTETTMRFDLDTPNVDNGWRQLNNYYRMRDLMEVFYLT